jgi:DNA excision repair protein ERCC-4
MIKITCDFREKPSGIPKLLIDNKADFSYSLLSTGDYVINDQIIVERKTAKDFIQSIMDNRLFEQCSKLKKDSRRILIIIVGDPYKTGHKMQARAIRGPILSILTAWQIPVICTQSTDGFVDLMMMLGNQSLKNNVYIRSQNVFRSKKLKSQKLNFYRESLQPDLLLQND